MKPSEEATAESMDRVLPLPFLSHLSSFASDFLQPLPGFDPVHSRPQVPPQPLSSAAGGGEARRLNVQPVSLHQPARSPRRPRWCCRGRAPHCRALFLGPPFRDWWGRAYVTLPIKGRVCDAGAPRGAPIGSLDANARWRSESCRRSLRDERHCSLLFSRRHRRLCCGTGCMVRPQSLMSKLSPSCGGVGHAFMEFLKVPGDYCQAQHDLLEEKWTVKIHHCSTQKPP